MDDVYGGSSRAAVRQTSASVCSDMSVNEQGRIFTAVCLFAWNGSVGVSVGTGWIAGRFLFFFFLPFSPLACRLYRSWLWSEGYDTNTGGRKGMLCWLSSLGFSYRP